MVLRLVKTTRSAVFMTCEPPESIPQISETADVYYVILLGKYINDIQLIVCKSKVHVEQATFFGIRNYLFIK